MGTAASIPDDSLSGWIAYVSSMQRFATPDAMTPADPSAEGSDPDAPKTPAARAPVCFRTLAAAAVRAPRSSSTSWQTDSSAVTWSRWLPGPLGKAEAVSRAADARVGLAEPHSPRHNLPGIRST